MNGQDRKQRILSALTILSRPEQVVETRIILQDGIGSGYYNNPEKLAEAVSVLDSNPQIRGIYITLNEMKPALLARRANRILMRLTKKDATTADQDIIRRRWLPIDIDPARPSGVSSSDEEHEAARAKALEIAGYLTSIGWPEPIIADSGNGAHLLYRIDLPNDVKSRDLVKGCLESLHIRFSDERCSVDVANFNAARIWKLYGTMSRKGDNTPERPYRFSDIISLPDRIEEVLEPDLVRLAFLYPDTIPDVPSSAGTGGQVDDLGTWLVRHGIGYEEKPYHDGTLYVLDRCPFSDAHQDGAYAIQFGSGGIFAGCHHDSCGGGTQRWKELKERFDGKPDAGERLSRLSKERVREKALAEGRVSPERRDERIKAEAEHVLRTTDPVRYILDAFSKEHEGDTVVATCLIMSLASRAVINSKGLHVSITGESGKGKSHTIDTMLSLVPDELRIDGRMSDKALFYINDLKPGSIIALDDVSLSDQMQEILKGVTSSFQRPFRYRTVSKERTGMTCIIPERCVWWITKVEGAGDDQVFNRMLTCWIDDSEELDKRVLERALDEASRIPATHTKIRKEVRVIRQIWRTITPSWVTIPFAKQIRFNSAANRRNPDMLLDLIKTFAVLNQFQRERSVVDGTPCVVATKEDFSAAAQLFDALNGDTGGQETKLTKREASLITAIQALNLTEMTVPDLQRITGWSNSSIYKLLNGYQSRGSVYSGLLEKCPAISYYERAITSGENGQTVSRRLKVFTWDQQLYESWLTRGTVTLRNDDPAVDEDFRDPGPEGGDGGCGKEKEDESGDTAQSEETFDSGSVSAEEGACQQPDSSPDDGSCVEAVRKKEGHFCRSAAPAADESSENILLNTVHPSPLRDLSLYAAEGELTGGEHSSPLSVDDTLCEFRVAEHDSLLSSDNREISKPAPEIERIPAAQCSIPAVLQISQIDPHEFVHLTGWPSQERCAVCGRKPTMYTQKMRIGQNNPPIMLCEACYHRAVSSHVARLVTLPGVIQTFSMVRRETGGRCSLCDILPVAWIDRESHIGLCESCYERESVRNMRENPE